MDHGALRNYHFETSSAGRMAGVLEDGTPVQLPGARHEQSACERFCVKHGWTEVRGIMGALLWHDQHRQCAS